MQQYRRMPPSSVPDTVIVPLTPVSPVFVGQDVDGLVGGLVGVVLPATTRRHCWLVPLRSVYCEIRAPFAVDRSQTSRALPLCRLTSWIASPMLCTENCWLLPLLTGHCRYSAPSATFHSHRSTAL